MPSSLWEKAPKGRLTTGIGSLPHAHVDAALKFSLKMRVPFLPQLPIRNPREFMLVQAIDGLPGVVPEEGGFAKLDETAWRHGTQALREKTDAAFKNSSQESAFEAFEPSPEIWSSWNGFLFELREREVRFAKIHLAGPMTCQWSVQTTEGTPADKNTELSMQVFRLILARAIAMTRRLKAEGTTPLFYLDEPGFFGFTLKDPKHALAFQELKLFIQTLQREGTLVGLHCCSNTDWSSILSLPLDVLSIDTNLSLPSLLENRQAIETFAERGGRLSLGVVPTGMHSLKTQSFTPELLVSHLLDDFNKGLSDASLRSRLLSEALVTPACGLALHTVEDAETILSNTLQAAELLSS